MDFLEKVVDTVTITGKEVISVAKDTKDIMVLKNQIKNNEREIVNQMYLIGEKYYELNKDVYDTEYAEFMEKIQSLKDDIAQKELLITQVGRTQ